MNPTKNVLCQSDLIAARALLMLGNTSKCLTRLKNLVIDPDNTALIEYKNSLAVACKVQMSMSEGRKALVDFLKCYQGDNQFKFRKLQLLLRGDERRAEIFKSINSEMEPDLMKKAELLISQNDLIAAEAVLKSLAKQSVDNPRISLLDQSLVLTVLGEVMMRLNKLLAAIDYFQQAKKKRKTIRNLIGFAQSHSLLGGSESFHLGTLNKKIKFLPLRLG